MPQQSGKAVLTRRRPTGEVQEVEKKEEPTIKDLIKK